MAATTKAALFAITDKEFTKLQALIAPIPTKTAGVKDADATSIKDVIGHRAHWIELFLGWYHDGQAGKEVHFPAPGYKWNQLKAYNAALRETQKDLTWPDARDLLTRNHTRLTSLIDSLDETALYGGPMKGANNSWTPGRWAEAAGPSHYRSAAKYIRARLREG